MVKSQVIPEKENHSYFWAVASIIIIILVITLTRGMPRPFGGLHSWADASGAWAARSHVKYGLAYTKGVTTWAVGNPPAQNPQRYMDHPQMAVLSLALFMKIFGVSEMSHQLNNLLLSIATLLIILKLFKALLDYKTALLAALLYTLFPLTGYFGMGGFPNFFGFLAIYSYLALTERIEAKKSKRFYMTILAVSLFMSLQFSWTGFFFGMAIGFDYLFQCLLRKKLPEIKILIVLAGAPLGSLFLDFAIMASGYGWDFNKIIELYKWRSAKGEMLQFQWDAWFTKLWEFASTNFTVPVLIAVILYLTIGQLIVFSQPRSAPAGHNTRRFPCLFLFFLLPFFQLFILKGALWKHQTWEMPLCALIAIATAQGTMLIGDLFAKINKKYSAAAVVVITGIFLIYTVIGTNYYYSIRWQPDAKIKMFQMLNSRIPPDKYLLSFDPFIVDQHSSKGAFYRPEIAWYLDREIVQASKLEEITTAAKTGKYPFYLLPLSVGDPQVDAYLANLSRQLGQLYKYEYIAGQPGEMDKKGRFLKAGMSNSILFDLNSPLK
jgi:4-amino-4-deoxy-L-arabinose transferase-like glycosyltransferase